MCCRTSCVSTYTWDNIAAGNYPEHFGHESLCQLIDWRILRGVLKKPRGTALKGKELEEG